ncbi:MAG: hypothetical protein AABY22_23375 [Nanoarchaeota archaeon]
MEGDGLDVGFKSDFSFFLKNAIALENHAEESFKATKNPIQKEIKEKIRQIRSKWMYRFIKDIPNEQIYCESKHTEACSMGLSEMASRFNEQGNEEYSKEALEDSMTFESLFFLLNFEENQQSNFIDIIKNKLKGGK